MIDPACHGTLCALCGEPLTRPHRTGVEKLTWRQLQRARLDRLHVRCRRSRRGYCTQCGEKITRLPLGVIGASYCVLHAPQGRTYEHDAAREVVDRVCRRGRAGR